MSKLGPYLMGIAAIIYCFLVGITHLLDGKMVWAGIMFSLVILNIATIIWLYRQKETK